MTLSELMNFCKDYCVSIIIGCDGNCTDPVRIGSQWPDNYWREYIIDERPGRSRLGKALRGNAKDEVKKLNLDALINYCKRNGVSLTIYYDMSRDAAVVKMKNIDYQCQYAMWISAFCDDMVSDENEHFQDILNVLKEKIDEALRSHRKKKLRQADILNLLLSSREQ